MQNKRFFQYFWGSGVRVDNENSSKNRQKTEPTSKDVLASIFGRFWLDFGRVLGSPNRPKTDRKRIQKHAQKWNPQKAAINLFQSPRRPLNNISVSTIPVPAAPEPPSRARLKLLKTQVHKTNVRPMDIRRI